MLVFVPKAFFFLFFLKRTLVNEYFENPSHRGLALVLEDMSFRFYAFRIEPVYSGGGKGLKKNPQDARFIVW